MTDTSITIENIMTREVTAVTSNTFMDVVMDIFRNNEFHHLPVLENGKVVGIISSEDIHKIEHYFTIYNSEESIIFNRSFVCSVPVIDVMSKQVATLRPTDKLSVAVGMFRENLFHAIPVVDNQRQLVGMLTTYDLLNHAYREPTFLS